MRFLRLLLSGLLLLTALAVLGLLAAISPIGQTWLAERWLAGFPGVRSSVDSVSAGFSSIESTDLRLEFEGGVLSVPALRIEVPLKRALWDRQWRIGGLVAKGWTLDLAPPPDSRGRDAPAASGRGASTAGAPAKAPSVPLRRLAAGLRALIQTLQLPPDATLDGVALEGDLLLPTDAGPARMKVKIGGGGVAPGQTATFALEAGGLIPTSRSSARDLHAHGQLQAAIGARRTLERLRFEGDLKSSDAGFPGELKLSVAVEGANADSFNLELTRAGRELATARAKLGSGNRLAGTWSLDLRDSDLGPFVSLKRPPDLALAGAGRFNTDPGFSDLHVTGRAKGSSAHWESYGPMFSRLGAATLAADGELTRRNGTLRFDRLVVSLACAEGRAEATARQPFHLDEATGAIKPLDPATDWLDLALRDLPLASLPELGRGFALAAGSLKGNLTARSANGTLRLASVAPLAATGVVIARDGQQRAEALDASLALEAEFAPQRGWRAQATPLILVSHGRHLATLEVSLAPVSEQDARTAIRGQGSADLEAIATLPGLRGNRWIRGRTASGNFSAKAGATLELQGKIAVVGHDAGRTLELEPDCYVDARDAISFRAPLRVATGRDSSELRIEGTWTPEARGARLEAEMTGIKVAFEHLSLLALARPLGLGAATAAILAGDDWLVAGLGQARDAQPFWGELQGAVKFEFYELKAGPRDFAGVAGALRFDRQSLRMENARANLVPAQPVRKRNSPAEYRPATPPTKLTATGAIGFDATAPQPYRLEASATMDVIGAAPLLGEAGSGTDPLVVGRFAVAGRLAGVGANPGDLLRRSRGQLSLTGKGGSTRLLRTNVAESMSADSTPTGDTLERLGSALGTLLGLPGGNVTSGRAKVAPATEAVLNFTYLCKDVLYDELAITAGREADGGIRLEKVELRSPQLHLSGTGRFAPAAAKPLANRPWSLELELGAKGAMAEQLSTAGLLAPDQDALGYRRLRQPLRFGGSLREVDSSEWRKLLLEAASPAAAKPKK